MPSSQNNFDAFVVNWVRNHWPTDTPILDVGAGSGKYGRLLCDTYPAMDALEVHEPYVEEFGLKKYYRHIHTVDLREFAKTLLRDEYKLAIMGDVLEHLSANDGQSVVQQLVNLGLSLIVVIPYLAEQDHAISWEHHRQPDLTYGVMGIRYPQLVRLIDDEKKGVYADKATMWGMPEWQPQ